MMQALVRSSLFRRMELQALMNLTARALGVPAERIWTRRHEDALRAYAAFTAGHLQGGVSPEILQRMNDEAARMGRRLRKLFRLKDPSETERFIFALYDHIGIAMEGRIPGEIFVSRCYFSTYYTPVVCLAASSLDEGIIRGLAGEGQLRFSRRLTEGCVRCQATFFNKEGK